MLFEYKIIECAVSDVDKWQVEISQVCFSTLWLTFLCNIIAHLNVERDGWLGTRWRRQEGLVVKQQGHPARIKILSIFVQRCSKV